MKKICLMFLMMFFSLGLMSQIPYYYVSKEREVVGTSFLESQKVVAYNNSAMITLSRTSHNSTVFHMTTEYDSIIKTIHFLDGFEVLDFQIFRDTIYFCGVNGEYNPCGGFVGWISWQDFVSGQAVDFTAHYINEAKFISKLTVYECANKGTRIGLIGNNGISGNHFFFDYIKNSSVLSYNFYVYSDPLLDIVNTNNHIIVLGKKTYQSEFFLTRFNKSDFGFISKKFSHSQNYDCFDDRYIIEVVDNEDYVFVGFTEHSTHTPLISVIGTQNLTYFTSQRLGTVNQIGKPRLLDMEYCSNDTTLLLLASSFTPTVSSFNDIVYQLKFSLNQSYVTPAQNVLDDDLYMSLFSNPRQKTIITPKCFKSSNNYSTICAQ